MNTALLFCFLISSYTLVLGGRDPEIGPEDLIPRSEIGGKHNPIVRIKAEIDDRWYEGVAKLEEAEKHEREARWVNEFLQKWCKYKE